MLTQTIPLDLAEAICGSETAGEAVALVLVFAGAMEFEGAAIELAGVAGAGSEAAVAGAAPESMADFLLLRLLLTGVALVSVVPAAVAGAAAGAAAAAPESAAAFLLLRVFLVGVAVVSADAVLAGSAAAAADFLLFLLVFFDPVSLAAAEVSDSAAASAEAAFLLFFVFLAGVAEASVAEAESVDAPTSFFAFFFFFLVVVVEVWSSVELAAWGLARALIPEMTNNTQSTIIHVLSLVCSLVMISSSPFRRLALDNFGSAPQGVWGTSRPVCGATIMTS